MGCADVHHWLQRRLDGEFREAPAIVERHLASCPRCRAQEAAAQRLDWALHRQPLPVPPAGFARRITVQALADRQRRLRTRQLWIGAALAASLLVVLSLLSFRSRQTPGLSPVVDQPLARLAPPVERPPAPASVDRNVAEAGSALVGLVNRTRQEALEQGRMLWATGVSVAAPRADRREPFDPTVQSLRTAGQEVTAGLEPVTDSARRAVRLFLHDLPLDRTGVRGNSERAIGLPPALPLLP